MDRLIAIVPRIIFELTFLNIKVKKIATRWIQRVCQAVEIIFVGKMFVMMYDFSCQFAQPGSLFWLSFIMLLE